MQKFNLTVIGHWAFVAGIALAILAGFVPVSYLEAALFILGLIVGFLHIKEKESTPFLTATIALLLIGVAGLQVGTLTEIVVQMLENFVAFVSAAGLIVALKQVIVFAKPASLLD
jgi:hypothetical protein